MSLTRKVAGGAIWLTAARLGGQLFGLASTIIVARFILPDDYGVFAAAMGVLMMASVFAELPVSQALIHLRDVREDDYDTAFTIGVLRGLIVALLMLALAWPLAAFMNDARIAPVTTALGGYIALLGLRNPRMESFARNMDFTREAALELTSKFASFVAAATFAVILKSYWALVIGVTAAALVQVLVSYAVKPVLPRFTLRSFRRLFSYSIWMAGNAIAGQIYALIDTLTLGRLQGPATLGVYSIGSLLSDRINQLVSSPASRSLFAAYAQIQGERERLQGAMAHSMSFMACVMIPIAVTLVFFAKPIVSVLLGPQWSDAVRVVQILGVILLVNIVYTPMLSLLMALGHTRTLFLRSGIFVAFYLPVTVYFTWTFGLTGLLWTKLVALYALMLVDLAIVRRAIGLSFWRQAATMARPGLAGVAMLALYVGLERFVPPGHDFIAVGVPLALACALGGLVYAATLAALWHMAGRPDGVELKAFNAGEGVVRRIQQQL